MKKRLVALALVLALSVVTFAGCGGSTPAPSSAAPAADTPAAPTETPAADPAPTSDGGKPYIAVVSKGFQHQFWQTVSSGASAAAEKYGVEITFDGPPSESDIAVQVDMVNAALAKNPAAIALAALDTKSLDAQLNQALASKIPVIGFDSGVPDAPAGSILATAQTNNANAGALGAQEMFKEAGVASKVAAATAENPVVIGVLSQDATSASVTGRTQGFVDEFKKLAEGVHAGAVAVQGHDVFNATAANPAAVILQVAIAPTTSATDLQATAQNLLQNTANLAGVFCSNEGAVTGMLAATADGTDLDRANGKYKDLIVVGFDAGAAQKNAVRKNYFYGSIAQDAYMIGYLSVELAYKAINGETLDAIYDTGAQFYNSANIDEPAIAAVAYD